MKVAARLSTLFLGISIFLIACGCGGGNTSGGVVQADTPSTPAILSASCRVVSNVPGNVNWLFPLGNIDPSCNSTGPIGLPAPSAGTLKNLRFAAFLGPAGTSTGIVTVFVNGTASPLACTAS